MIYDIWIDIYIHYNIYIYSLKVACPSKLFFFASPKQPKIWSFRKEKLLVTRIFDNAKQSRRTFKSSPNLKKPVAHLRLTKKECPTITGCISEVLLYPSAHEIRKDLLGAFHQLRVILEEPGHRTARAACVPIGQGSQGSHIFIYSYSIVI